MHKGERKLILGGDFVSNSSLICYTKISPNKTSPRNHKIDTITIHCMAGNLSIESCGNLFAKTSTKASSNYGIGSDGRIALYVDEKDRSWASSNSENDNRAITIEVANDGGAETGWHVSDKAYDSLINLLVDICKRNGIKELLWKADKNLIGQIDKQNMTVHRWFKNKACPGDYLYKHHYEIAHRVNARLAVSSKIQNETEIPDKPKYIWDTLKKAGFTDIATAGVMGNLYDESHFLSNNLQNSFEKKFNMDDEAYTSLINAKLYPEESFAKDGAGYGLAQWTYWTRKQNLYKYTIKQGYRIDDFYRQLDFFIEELKSSYGSLFTKLNSSKTVREASDLMLTQYERPADQGITVQERRANYATLYYNKYSGKEAIVEKTNLPYSVKVNRNDLNIRKGPGTNFAKTGKVTGIGVFTIVEEVDGWGLLRSYQKNRDGWIYLSYTTK